LRGEYRVSTARDGAEGLRMILDGRPHLVITDLMMPELTGDAVVREVRARPEVESTPILLLTARSDDESRVALLKSGASDYVMKPFVVEELRARVRNLIGVKLADDRNRALHAELAQANKELEAFSYSVSHDLRAPLRAIDGFSFELLDHASAVLDDTGREYLQRVRAAARRMSELIEALLHLSRLTRGPLTLTKGIDLSALARAIADDLRHADPGRRVRVTIDEGITADADAALIRVVLENLLRNAWKFTGPVPDPVIHFGWQTPNGQPTYFVRDNGVGFNAEFADRLFTPFQRLHHESEFPGTGVGLATVSRIVRRHGGTIRADAEVGRGATFSWTLGPAPGEGPRM
jgi:signal transduction histidine kinase